MILAHLPAGYIASKLLHKRLAASGVAWKPFLWAGLLGAVAPDLDMLYYLIDASRHHHAFFTHFPAFWGGLLLAAGVWYRLARDKRLAVLAVIFALNGVIHLCLDSVAGSIRWLAPFDFQPFAMTTVPRLSGSRRLDYLMHWSSWVELIPIGWALWLWRWKWLQARLDTNNAPRY